MWRGVCVGTCALVASAGCFVVPVTKVTRNVIGTDTQEVVPPQRAPMELQLQRAGSRITVRAFAPRTCVRETYEDVDVTREPSADLAAGDLGNDPLAVLVVLIVAPVTLAISGIITAIVVSSRDTTVKRERHKLSSQRHECPAPGPGLRVMLTLPSGATLDAVTDDKGEAIFSVPEGEPDAGTVAASIAELGTRNTSYNRGDHRDECLQRRSEAMRAAQQETDLKERTRQLQALPACPAR